MYDLHLIIKSTVHNSVEICAIEATGVLLINSFKYTLYISAARDYLGLPVNTRTSLSET